MDTAMKQWAMKFKRARSNLLLVVIFTAANLLLTAFNAGVYMLFSATGPQFVFEVGRGLAEEFQSTAFLVAGLIIAFISIGLYFLCWLLAKRRRAFILVALIFFCIDCLLFVLLLLSGGFEVSYLLDIVFHGWILFSLISGTRAWAKLRGVSAEDLDAALQNPAETAAVQPQIAEGYHSAPLRLDDKKGRILIAADYEDLQISMKRTRGLTELIVNDTVYDEVRGIVERDYTLTAYVQNNKIAGMCKSGGGIMYLYVNDVLIAQKRRLY
ncbi:MAG: hypothetical protein FWF10_08355 [Clostridiales bacterium]|nr:hypothetical protein [Clostridiales bacterium]